MQQRWWIGVVAVVGIGLAILLFPRPDTGADIPPPDPSNTNPLDFDGEDELPKGAVRSPRAGNTPRPKVDPTRAAKGPNPAAKELQELRSSPTAVYAAKLTAPWSAMRYTLLNAGTEESKALADEINPVLSDLRTLRRDPNRKPFSEIEAAMQELDQKVAASEWAADETISTSLERHRALLVEFHQADAGGTPTEGQPEGEGEGAPQED